MLYRLQFALDMAGYLFVPFHSKSIVHVKNRVPSIAAIDLLLQLSSCTRVIIAWVAALERSSFLKHQSWWEQGSAVHVESNSLERLWWIKSHKEEKRWDKNMTSCHKLIYRILMFIYIYIFICICMYISFHFLASVILEETKKQLSPTCPSNTWGEFPP